MDSLKVSQESISHKAQEILNTFLQKMNSIHITPEYNVSRKQCMREEYDNTKGGNEEFIQNFLNNAPNSNNEAILTKKGEWIK